jgi:hypothetical protein
VVADGQDVPVTYTCGTGTTCQVGALPSGITVSLNGGTGTITAAPGTAPGTYNIVLNGTMPGQTSVSSTLNMVVETPKHPAIAYPSGASTFLRQRITVTPTVFADMTGGTCTTQLLGDDLTAYGVKYIYADTARVASDGTLTYVASNTPFRTVGYRDVKVVCTVLQVGRTLTAETTVRITLNRPVFTGGTLSGAICANGNSSPLFVVNGKREALVANTTNATGYQGTVARIDQVGGNTPPPGVIGVPMEPANPADLDRITGAYQGAIPPGHPATMVLRVSNNPAVWEYSVEVPIDYSPSCGT